jgi:hypothetical protein
MVVVARLLRGRPTLHSGGTERWNEALGASQIASRGIRTLETGCGASPVNAGGAMPVIEPSRSSLSTTFFCGAEQCCRSY